MRSAWTAALGLAALLALSTPASAQHAGEEAWTTLLRHEGLVFSYIFYAAADHQNDGVVVKLENTNAYAIDYRFEIVFRTQTETRSEEVTGRLAAGEARTGSADGLFWVPFPDGEALAEIGLRGYRIRRSQERDGPFPES